MSLRVAHAVLCFVLPLVLAVSLTVPTSTQSSIHSTSLPPAWSQTTPPPSPALRRRDYTTSSHGLGGAFNSICGFPEGNITASAAGCPSGTCVYHPSDTKYPDMLACCTSDAYCGFFTTCMPGTEVSKTPSILTTQAAFTLPCIFDDSPECVTQHLPEINATNYICGSVATSYTFYTTALVTTTSGTVHFYNRSLSTVDSDFVNSFSTTEYFTDGDLPTSGTVLEHTNSPSSDSNNTDSHTTNKGAIAGGVVGGVAGVALLAGAGFFLLKRRKSKQNPSGDGDNVSDSGSGAGEHKGIAEVGTKHPKELDSVAAQLAEMQGSTPVGELQGTDAREMRPEMQGSDVREMAHEMPDTEVKKDFAVEHPDNRS